LPLKDPIKEKEYQKDYYLKNKIQRNAYDKTYYQKHRKTKIRYSKKYNKNHKKEKTTYNLNYMPNYRQTHKGKRKEYCQINRRLIREIERKCEGKRRNLGFNIIWKPEVITEPMHFHHINKVDVIQIPERIHKSIYHNIWTGEGITKINQLAFEYVFVNMGVLPQSL
jgi:hypothetical protein